MRSLWVRLTGTFVLIVLAFGVVNTFLINRATQAQFSRYTSQTGLAWAENIAPSLEQYYFTNRSWEGVESVFQTSFGMRSMMMGGTMMPGMPAGMLDATNVWDMMGFRLLLVNADGRVQVDTSTQLVGTTLTPDDLLAGIPLWMGSTRIGTVLALDVSISPDSTSSEFLQTLQATTWQASFVVAIFALLLGSLLFQQIIAPVRKVTQAAGEFANGDLAQRVPEGGLDEVGQLARTFNQMADALARDRQLRQNMTADIAHELRTPLSIVQGNLEAMLDGILPASPEEIASLHDEILLLNRLVNDLRLLSLAETGQLQLDLVNTDLLTLIRQTIFTLRPTAEAMDITLLADLPDSLPTLKLDADRTNQILRNLLSNALRYTPPGGTIRVEASRTEHFALVEVSDTGDGISVEDLPYVFERFYRADKSRNRASGGSGIGLAIVRQLMLAQGGDVSAESPVEVYADGVRLGSRFTLRFPLS